MADQSVRLYSWATRTSGSARSRLHDVRRSSAQAYDILGTRRHPARDTLSRPMASTPSLRLRRVHRPRCFADALLGSSSAVPEPNDRQGLIEHEPAIAISRRHKKRKNTCKASTFIPEKRGWEPR